MAEFESKEYDAENKRLFYSYRIGVDDIMPLSVGGISNNQRWRVAVEALDHVMPTFNDTPAVVKPRASGNPLELEMFSVGNFLHPIAMPVVKNGAVVAPSIHDHRQYNETYAIGRNKVYKNAHGQWRFRIEITDPKAKEVMLKGENEHLFPPYISAQVFMLPPHDKDLQNLRNVVGSHVAFVDRPAGGFEKMKLLAKCHDNEETCQIKLMNASQAGTCGFCPGDAMAAMVKSGSSHLSKNDPSLTDNMSFNPQSTGSGNSIAITGEKVTRIIKDPNYRRGSEVERPEDQKRPNNGTPAPGEGEDEETRKLRTELEEVRRERAERQTANVSEAEKLKAEMKDEILSLKKEKSRTKIEKFMDKTKHIFKTRKAWEDAVEDMLTKLPYDDNDRLIQRLAELEEIWLNRAEAMMAKTKSASLQSNPDAGMRSVPKFGQQVGDSSIADVCLALAEALKRGIN